MILKRLLESIDPALMTFKEYMKSVNRQGKHHEAHAYDFTLDQANRLADDTYMRDFTFPLNYSRQLTVKKNNTDTLFTVWIENKRIGWADTSNVYMTKHDLERRDILDAIRNRFPNHQVVVRKYPVRDFWESILERYEKNRFPKILRRFRSGDEVLVVRQDADGDMGVFNERHQRVAGAQDEWGAVLIWVAREYRGRRIGPLVGKLYRDENPDKDSGGFTTAGYRNLEQIWSDHVQKALSSGRYTRMVKQGEISKDRVREILANYKGPKKPQRFSEPSTSPKVRALIGETHVVLYDTRFYKYASSSDFEKLESFIHGYGLLTGLTYNDQSEDMRLFRLEYDNQEYENTLVTLLLHLAAEDGVSRIRVGAYGDDLVQGSVPGTTVEGDYLSMTRDPIPGLLGKLRAVEKAERRPHDPYGEVGTLIIEVAEAKWQ